jgi:hypothetical protein
MVNGMGQCGCWAADRSVTGLGTYKPLRLYGSNVQLYTTDGTSQFVATSTRAGV